MEALVDSLEAELSRCCADEAGTVHFVTHSMGGVLVRSYLAQQLDPHRGRVVMLSPPNQGSEVIDAFADSPMLRLVAGPAGSKLGTDSAAIPSQLGPVRFSLGIIAGDRSLNPLYSWLIPGPDDGKVGVDRARVEGAADFLVVPATHTFIMNRRDVAEQVVYFLENGRFRPAESVPSEREPGPCQPFMDELEAVPQVELSMRMGELESVWDREPFTGCEIEFETNDSLTYGTDVPNFDAIEGTEMHRRGWRPTDGIGADGPGSGVFGIEKGATACVIRWSKPAYIDDDGTFVQSETLNMTIQCRDGGA